MPVSIENTVIRFNDGTTQSTAAGAGGVTSLNGQTGAVVTTTNNNIGATQLLAHASSSVGYITGTTLAGSSLYSPTSLVGYFAGIRNPVTNGNTNGSAPSTFIRLEFQETVQNTSGNAGQGTPRGFSTVSGTWRSMGAVNRCTSSYDSEGNVTNQNYGMGIWVRIS